MKYIYDASKPQHEKSKSSFGKRFVKLGYTEKDLEALHHYLQNYAPLIVHVSFQRHIKHFLKDTHYRSIFELQGSCGYRSNK